MELPAREADQQLLLVAMLSSAAVVEEERVAQLRGEAPFLPAQEGAAEEHAITQTLVVRVPDQQAETSDHIQTVVAVEEEEGIQMAQGAQMVR
jgi:hypothetical protein